MLKKFLVSKTKSKELLRCFYNQNSIEGIDFLIQSGKVDELKNFYKEKNIPMTTYQYNTLIKASQQSKKFEKNLNNILKEMLEKKISKNKQTYSQLIQSYCLSQQIPKALEIHEEMKNKFEMESKDYTNTILNLANASKKRNSIFLNFLKFFLKGYLNEAKKIYHEMIEIDLKPNLRLLTALIKIFKNHGKIEVTEEFMDDLERFGIEKTIQIYTSLISGYLSKKNEQKSIELFNKMKESKIEPDSYVYGSLIIGLLKMNKNDKAENYFNELLKNNLIPTQITFNAFLKYLCGSSNQLDRANSYFEKFKNKIEYDKITYTTLIGGNLRIEKLEKAKKIFQEMKEKKIKFDFVSYNQFILYYLEHNDIENSIKLFEEMKSFSLLNVDTLNLFIFYFKSKNLNEKLEEYEIEKENLIKKAIEKK